MLKNLFRFFCIVFIIRNLSAGYSKECCTIYLLIFKNNIEEYADCEIVEIVERALYDPVYNVIKENGQRIISFDCRVKMSIRNPIIAFDGSIRSKFSIFDHIMLHNIYRGIPNFYDVLLHSVTIETSENTTSLDIPKFAKGRKTYELIWVMNSKCHLVNEIINEFKEAKKIMLNANLINFNECDDFSFRKATQLTFLKINVNRFLMKNAMKFVFPATFLGGMKNLKEFNLNCEFHEIQKLMHLKPNRLDGCGFYKLSAEHFKDLTNLRVLNLSGMSFEDFDWISSKTLANHVEIFDISASIKANKTYFEDIQYFANYTNLRTVIVDPPLDNRSNIKGYTILPYICKGRECTFFGDQTKIYCPTSCNCEYENQNMRLELNCPKVEFAILFKPGLGPAALYLSNTSVTRFLDESIYNISSVQDFHLANNQLDDLNISQLPENLTILDIRNNSFKFLRPELIEFMERRNETLLVKLSGNPWNCDCYPPIFMRFIERVPKMIEDLERVKCDGETPSSKMVECRLRLPYLLLGLTILLSLICAILFWFRTSILMWLYYHDICVNCIRHTATNLEFHQRFDAFLAYSHKNIDLVNEYVDQLENGPREFKLCFYHRDWAIGQSIPACILQSIEDSRRIILLMTSQFIKSSWGTFEFRTAIKATSMDSKKRLIIIVYPDVENFDNLDSELRIYMKYNTYLRRDDSQFWKKLIFVMPHKKVKRSKKKTKQNVDNEGTV